MKKLPIINGVLILITAIGYLAIFIGVILHILTGVFQLITYLALIIQYKRWNYLLQIHLKVYGVLTTIVLGLFFLDLEGFFATMVIASIPLAIYFMYITTLLKNNTHDTNRFNHAYKRESACSL
jgi:hypothetical protein